ncbi:hypothetical protein HYPSUDRAFT_89286 [Hypholoma sublateritium FD-334 SS-4]|uniref:Uncharacterized protein n=1 Tax=Hypholoma sublateritium (strain FD-334 SS-4) TaxID=945553 RepID=A0A0D2NKY3_HYPSF|nr:hypothetical protein HYPSUDRAFT_89286 [Hypholoma sublateritium FD-334 SS-4]
MPPQCSLRGLCTREFDAEERHGVGDAHAHIWSRLLGCTWLFVHRRTQNPGAVAWGRREDCVSRRGSAQAAADGGRHTYSGKLRPERLHSNCMA